jgi:Helicase conserved C-terminal domain
MSTDLTPSVDQQMAMADFITAAVVDDATGVSEGDRCVGEPPSARYYLATLAPADLDLAVSRERRGRRTPNALGFEFEVERPDARLHVTASVSCYYAVLPKLDEQRRYLRVEDVDLANAADLRLAPVFQEARVTTGRLHVRLDPAEPVRTIGREQFAAAFEEVRRRAAVDPSVDRRPGEERRERRIPASAMADETTFAGYLAAVLGEPVLPSWSAEVAMTARPVARGRMRVTVMLVNLSSDPRVTFTPRGGDARKRHDDAKDQFLFRTSLEVASESGVIVPIEMDLGPDAYRYDPSLAAYATNCGVAVEFGTDGAITEIRSVPAPGHATFRTVTLDDPATAFDVLAGDPIIALHDVAAAMRAYADDPDWSVAGLDPDLAARKAADREAFADEIRRFEEGVRWLERDERLLLAFRLANQTMIRLADMAGDGRASWRRFQLVFIVSQLPALAWREHDPADFTPGLWGHPKGTDPTAAVTVLWFPTAGGKTEAYLGLIACALFYDRARGKSVGVTAWSRFPLRLLTLDQTARQLELVVAADEVRLSSADAIRGIGGDPGARFALGFYAGERNSPNSLSRDPDLLERLISDELRRKEVRLVDECPYCRERAVEVDPPDRAELRLVHRCRACGRELPLHIVDSEIYRYLPSVIVGTLDKLAMIGLSDKFGAILGDVDGECPLHGYGRGGKCHERRATAHPAKVVRALSQPLYDASPSLEIVDELHLVREELGAFSGHYEGLLSATQRELTARSRPDGRPVRMKVVATTATIRGEDRQCEHLFGLRSVVVPLPGPTLLRSFYWRLDPTAPLRRFVGIMPNRSTADLALVRILVSIHSAIRRLETGGPTIVPGLAGIDGLTFVQLLDVYRVSITYVTSLLDFGKLRRSMDTQVNETLRRLGMRELLVKELSGDSDIDDLRSTRDSLKSGGPVESVVVTSMFSHGVDIDRLNVMVFNGMPKSMAEYIQASSRVGRRYLGVVFMIFNPVRERDRSHFRYHGKFHEYLDRMVEPVAINRWSRYAATKTLPGIFMGYVLQTGNRHYWDAGRAPRHLHDLVNMQDALRPPDAGGVAGVQRTAISDSLHEAYLVDRDEAAELRDEIDRDIETAVSYIRSAGAAAGAAARGRPQYRATGDHLGLGYDPMTSLRDVAEGIPFFTVSDRRRP